jgi:hypothetical protein
MWRKWITILLGATAVASGQAFPTQEAAQSSAGIQTAEMRIQQARVVQRHNKLRRGRDEQLAIVPATLSRECLAQTSIGHRFDADPSSLHLEPAPDFTIRFGDGKNFKSESTAFFTQTNSGKVILLNIKADRNMPMGDYVIRGKLGFFATVKESCSGQQEVIIPMTIVDHDAKVAKNEWPFQPYSDHHFGESLGNTFLTILIIPLLPFLFIYGEIACGSPFCQD